MKILNEIIGLINPEYIVCSDKVGDVTNSKNEYKIIKDARSAAFYAFGKSKISNSNVVLIVNGDYLSNTYTALTEAWFQKTNLIIIALYNSIYDIETNYLDRCIVGSIKFIDKDYEQFKEKINELSKLIGPKLINIAIERKEEKFDYTCITNELKKIVQQKDTVFIYNSESIELPCEVKNVEEKYKYGIFSKYLGYISASNKNKQILICTAECLETDLNILNNKAMNKNFKAIVVGNIENLRNWVEKNNLKFITCKDFTKDSKILYNSNQATILNLKED